MGPGARTAMSSIDLLRLFSCAQAMELALRLVSWPPTELNSSFILSRSSSRTMTQLSHAATDTETSVPPPHGPSLTLWCSGLTALTFTVHAVVVLYRYAVLV